jgi:acyl-CoA thioesterase
MGSQSRSTERPEPSAPWEMVREGDAPPSTLHDVSAWDDLDLVDAGGGRYTTKISADWQLAVAAQGGVVAALATRAMELALGRPDQSLRTMTAMFAAPVACGEVELKVQVLRKGRSMSQLSATVRNVGADAGLAAVAAFGASRRGFEFTELTMPDVPGPEGLRGFRDPLPEGIVFEFDRPPMAFWEDVLESRPVIGRPPWEPFADGPAETAYWYRFDDPPTTADGHLDVAGVIVMSDTMPGSVGQKLGPDSGSWFAPSVDFTLHSFRPASTGWLLAHHRARHAGDGYASVDCALWDPAAEDGPALVAYATQVMLFSFI